jgi:N-acetylglucosamine-6-sulfatase
MNKHAASQPRTLTRRRFLGVSGATLAAPYLLSSCVAGQTSKPNFLFIMLDDMAPWMLEHMPTVLGRISAEGMTFKNFYGAQPLCSPNRATFLTGRYPHNHTIINNDGAARQFREKRLDQDTFATQLKSAGGYKNGFVGKYFNGYAASSENRYVPPGWDYWVGLASDGNPTIRATVNGRWSDTGVSVSQEAKWLADHVDSFIRNNASVPWFCFYGPRAPHGPYTPSPASEHYADDIPLRRPANFNEPDGMSDKPTGVGLSRTALTRRDIAKLERLQEGSLEELQDVDVQVDKLLDSLSTTGLLANTYVFFTSDNGFMLGENRQTGKNWPYEASAKLPLVIRGPGVDVGSSGALASMVDVRATLANLAGVAGDVAYDGRSLADLFSGTHTTWRKRLLFESPPYTTNVGWFALFEPPHIYVEWSTGAKELYDLVADPGELESLHASRPELVITYSSRLAALKTAQGDALRQAEATPSWWKALRL